MKLSKTPFLFLFLFAIAILGLTSCQQSNQKETPVKELTAAQKTQYSDLKNEAWSLYEAGNYLKSAQKYMRAFEVSGTQSLTSDRYNAACSWALSKQADSAFVQLFRIADKGKYSNHGHITTDTDLSSLHGDQRWEKITSLVKKNKDYEERNLDKPLVDTLDKIYEEDQGLRMQIKEVEDKHGRDSDEMRAHWDLINEKDSVNLIQIQEILDERGWLGADIVGKQGNATLFLVIQHSPIEVQQKYLPMMREAVKNKNARPSSLALLEDRVALRTGKRQIYGSQIGRDPESGEHYVSPIEDPENVDQRRAEVGLGTLNDYVGHWDMTWDIEKHKARTAKIEAEEKK